MKIQTPIILAVAIISIVSLSGCSSKQMFMAGQDIKCQKQEKQDPYNQQSCKKDDFEEYQKQREAEIYQRENGDLSH